MTHKVNVIGYGIVFPEGDEGSKLTPDLGVQAVNIPRKLKRFSARSVPAAFGAVEQAVKMANIDLTSLPSESFGLYTGQSCYQHPDLDDYADGLAEWQQKEQEKTLFDSLWDSRVINPFLVIKGLGNNLLGMLSLAWELRGDCAAFSRDQAGAGAALEEARFNITQGICDTCLVVVAGATNDVFDMALNNQSCEQAPNTAAVALILQSDKLAGKNALAELNVQPFSYQTVQKPFKPTADIQSLIKQAEFFGEAQQEWGGIVLSIAQSIAIMQQNSVTETCTIYSQDAQGLQCQASVKT